MRNGPPLTRVELIDASMSCFTLGLISLLPVIGLPIAVLVLSRARGIRRREAGMWNPARRYLFWGQVCASWGAGISTLAAVIVGMIAAFNSSTYHVLRPDWWPW